MTSPSTVDLPAGLDFLASVADGGLEQMWATLGCDESAAITVAADRCASMSDTHRDPRAAQLWPIWIDALAISLAGAGRRGRHAASLGDAELHDALAHLDALAREQESADQPLRALGLDVELVAEMAFARAELLLTHQAGAVDDDLRAGAATLWTDGAACGAMAARLHP